MGEIVMKKTNILCLIIIAIIGFSLFSCVLSQPFGLEVCANFSKPGMFCDDIKGACEVEIIEQDSYGRTLFEYSTENAITSQEETIFVVCQGFDDDYTYFYEDINYIDSECSQEALDALKQQNDWNQPFDESKMSRRYNQVTFDLFIVPAEGLDNKKARKAVLEHMSIGEDEKIELYSIDTDSKGQEIYCLNVMIDGEKEQFFIFVNLSYEIETLKIEKGQFDKEAYVKFKHDNGWTYGW